MKKLFIIILSYLFIINISCKDDKTDTKEEKVSIKKNNVSEKPKEEPNQKPFLYKAVVNSSSGLILRKENDTKSQKLILIPKNTSVNIINLTDKFETIKKNKKLNYYGKWVEIEYKQPNGEYISGFVFDDFLNYQFDKKEYTNQVTKDTITVTNEREFINALTSNRVIHIETDEINLEKFINEYERDDYGDESIYYKDDFEDSDDIESSYEMIVIDFEHKSLTLYNYNNIEIIGKNKMTAIFIHNEVGDVLSFYNCNNFLIDNLNILHKTPVDCGGLVTNFFNCSNFYLQNTHFDGTGTIGANIVKSENFNFLNCEFYYNSRYGTSIDNCNDINFNRCDFRDNYIAYDIINIYTTNNKTKAEVNITDCYITNNSISGSVINTYQINDDSDSKNYKTNIKNCNISNNDIYDYVFNLNNSKKTSILVLNSQINNNESLYNKSFVFDSSNPDSKLTFEKTQIANNENFYNFNASGEKPKENSFLENNIYNSASDTILNDYNTYSENKQVRFKRSIHRLKYNEETKKISVNEHLLEGLHHIIFDTDKTVFFNIPIDLTSNSSGEGNIINGRLDGLWEIKKRFSSNEKKYHLTYTEGILKDVQILDYIDDFHKYKPLSKGQYKEGKKHGVWKYYFLNGTVQKETTYDNGKDIGPYLYYFPDGQLREKREDLKNENGKTTGYYPNGKTESIIAYKNGNIDVPNSVFYDLSGIEKEAIEVESLNRKNTLNSEEISSGKYENKAVVFYKDNRHKFYGYTHYSNGKISNIYIYHFNDNKSSYKTKINGFSIKAKSGDYIVSYFDCENSLNREIKLVYDDQNNIKYYSFIDKDNYTNLYTYGGEFNLLKDIKVIKN